MFEEIKNIFYQSLAKSIRERKELLGLENQDILPNAGRMSEIINGVRDRKNRYMIYPGEYPYLNYLFTCNDHDAFINKNILSLRAMQHIEKHGSNYDDMFWGHVDWDDMFWDIITELSESDVSCKLTEQFEDTVD